MKYLKLILLTFVILSAQSGYVFGADNGLPSKINILKNSLSLKESKGDKRSFIAEYIPSTETFDNWTSMFAVRYVPGEIDPKVAAQSSAKNIKLRKEKGDQLANSMILEAPNKKSIVLDFLISDADLVEHNVWRYFKYDGGLISYQIARRLYSKDKTSDFIRSVKDMRAEILSEITRKDLPIPEFK